MQNPGLIPRKPTQRGLVWDPGISIVKQPPSDHNPASGTWRTGRVVGNTEAQDDALTREEGGTVQSWWDWGLGITSVGSCLHPPSFPKTKVGQA